MNKLPQDAEEFIAKNETSWDYLDADEPVVPVAAFRDWMTGHVRVPVELIESLRSHVFEGNVIRFGLRDTKASRRAIADLLNASKGE